MTLFFVKCIFVLDFGRIDFAFTSVIFLTEKKYSSDEYFFHVVMRQKMLYQPCLKGTCKSVQTTLESMVVQG